MLANINYMNIHLLFVTPISLIIFVVVKTFEKGIDSYKIPINNFPNNVILKTFFP